MYDWANSAFQTTIIAAIFPIYFQKVAAAGMPGAGGDQPLRVGARPRDPDRRRHRAAARRDRRLRGAVKKRLLGVFLAIGAVGDRRDVLHHAAATGCSRWCCSSSATSASPAASSSTSRCCRTWPARKSSTACRRPGYALGYVGGGVLLAINIADDEQAGVVPSAGPRHCGPRQPGQRRRLVGRVLDPALPPCPGAAVGRIRARERPTARALVIGGRSGCSQTLRELRRYRQAFMLLLAFLLYNDGIQTIIRMATIYGTEIGLDDNAMIGALLVTQFIGVPFAFLFGMFAEQDRRQARRSSSGWRSTP